MQGTFIDVAQFRHKAPQSVLQAHKITLKDIKINQDDIKKQNIKS